MTKKKRAKKSTSRKASRAKSSASNKQSAHGTLELIDGLDSKAASVQPVLRKLAAGEKVSPKVIDALDDGDSRLTQVVPILRAISEGKANASTVKAIHALDAFGTQLQPVLLALAK